MADSGAVCLVVGVAAMLAANAAARVEAQRIEPAMAIARNVRVGAFLEPCLGTMLERSATFRRTYAAIAHRRDVRVSLTFDLRSDATATRAKTDITRFGDGGLVAAIHLYTTRDVVELIAHEMEHVREQTEGVNLRLLAMIRSPGIVQVGRNRFESERAVNVGLKVAGEVGHSGDRLCGPEVRNAALIRQPF